MCIRDSSTIRRDGYPLHSPRPNRLWFWLAVTGLLAVIVVTVRATESQVCNERFTQEAPLHFVDVGTVSVLGGQRVGVDYSAPEINSPSVVGGGLYLVTILSGCEINNFVGQPASESAITLWPCLTCFGSGSEPCLAGFGRVAV